MKKLFLFLAFICAFSQASADQVPAILEDNHVKLYVYPNTSVTVSGGTHTQYGNFTNKMDRSGYFNVSLRFSENITLESAYLLRKNTTNSTNITYYWSEVSLTYIYKGTKHYHVAYNAHISSGGWKYFKFEYTAVSDAGKWDLIYGGFYNNSSGHVIENYWILDPYWGVGEDSDYTGTESGGATGGLWYWHEWGLTDGQSGNSYDCNGTLWLYRELITITNGTGATVNFSSYQVAMNISNSSASCNQFRVVFYNDSDCFEIASFIEENNLTSVILWWVINFSVNPLNPLQNNFYIYWGNQSVSNRDYDLETVFTQTYNNTMVVWCPFNADATDFSGYGNDGSVFEAVFTTTNPPMHPIDEMTFSGIDGYYTFDGVDDLITITDSADFDNSGEISFSFWMKCDDLTLTMRPFGVQATVVITVQVVPSDSDFIYWTVRDSNSVIKAMVGTIPAIKDQWMHVVAVLDDPNLYLYVDNVLSNTDSAAFSGNFNPTTDLGIGGRPEAANDDFNGSIDDFRFYKRALNVAEIERLYYRSKYSSAPPILGVSAGTSTIPVLSANVSVDFSDSQVATQHSATITFEETGGENSITIDTYVSNHSDYTSSCANIIVGAGNTNTTTVYFTPSIYYDSNVTGVFIWVVDTSIWSCSNDTTITTGLSTTPTLTYYNTSDFGDCQVATRSAYLLVLVTLGDFSCPNNVSLLAYHRNDTQFYMYFNLSTVNGSQNVSYSVYWIPSIYYDSDFVGAYTFSVDETYGAIDNESLICPFWGYSSTPSLTYSIQNIDFGDIQIDTESAQDWLNLTNTGSANYVYITGITLNSNFSLKTSLGVNDTWAESVESGNFKSVDMSSSGQYQTTVGEFVTMYISDDYGATWTAKDNRDWSDVSVSSSGQYQTAVVEVDKIYISDDYGATWTAKDSNRDWKSVSVSSSGQYQTAVAVSERIYISDDYGATWTAKGLSLAYYGVSVSSSGQYQTAVVYGGQIYISDDYGATWTAKENNRQWYDIALSSYGQYQTATVYQGQIYISDDYGATWIAKDSNRDWIRVDISSNGKKQIAVALSEYVYTSGDYGATWIAKESIREWRGASISSEGDYLSAVVYGGYIYTYNDLIVLSNNYLLVNFTTTPTFYIDQFNHTFTWLLDEQYGSITQDTATLSFNSSKPILANLIYDYNGSYTNILPEDVLPFNFSINNTNLNTIQIKQYDWTLQDTTIDTNFSVITSAQYVQNDTYCILDVIREVSSFTQRVQNLNIWFYGIGSEDANNVFNLSISPNFSMVDFDYTYPVLTTFLDKDLDTKYTDTWTLYNTGTYTYNVTTRTDNYADSDFEAVEWNYLPGESTYHTVDLNNIFKITFTNTPATYHSEFWFNASASVAVTLKILINGVSHTKSIGTSWKVYNIFTDDLTSGTNTFTFSLNAGGPENIYISNVSSNSNITLYKYVPLSGWVEQTTSCFALDILFSDFIQNREIEKYASDVSLQITGGNDNEWDLVYYPSAYTQDSLIRINVILENSQGRYLDNFTYVIEAQCPRYVVIISDIDSIDTTIYAGEDNSIYITFENIGVINATIINITTSLSWLNVDGGVGESLNIGETNNITFVTTSTLGAEHIDNSFVLTITMTTTNAGSFSDWTYIYVQGRAILVVTPLTRTVTRDAGEDKTESFTLTNNGLVSGTFYVYISYQGDDVFHNSLASSDDIVILDAGETTTLEFTVSGLYGDKNETWIITIEEGGEVKATMTFYSETSDVIKWHWLWSIILWILIPVLLIGAAYIPKDKTDSRIKPRRLLKLVFVLIACACFFIPLYYYTMGQAEAPWKVFSDLKNDVS